MSPDTVNKSIRERKLNPRLSTILALSQIAKVRPAWLAFGDGAPEAAVSADERYPNRALAVTIALLFPRAEMALEGIQHVARFDWKMPDDQPVSWWLEQIAKGGKEAAPESIRREASAIVVDGPRAAEDHAAAKVTLGKDNALQRRSRSQQKSRKSRSNG